MATMRRVTAAAVLIGLAASPAGAQLPFPKNMPPPVPTAGAAPDQKLTPERQLLTPEDFAARRKLAAFVTCLNGVTGLVPNLARPYRDAFRAVSKDPVNGLDHTSYNWMYQSKFLFHGPATMGHSPTQECADSLVAAAAQPPADEPLDTLAAAYAADLRKLDALAPKVEAYYNGKDFRDDAMAHGREMNAEYDPLLQRLLAEGHEMFALTRAREAVLQQHRLDGIERLDGRQLRWQANAFMVQARATLDGLQALVAAKKVAKPAVLALVVPLEARFAEASAYAAAHPAENNDEMNLWDKIQADAPDFMTAAKQARRDADAPPNGGRSAEKVSDDTESMARYFRNMVNSANSSKR